jgi:glutaredoxin
MKRIFVPLLVLSVLLWTSHALSAPLDEKKLLSVVCERLNWGKKIPTLKPEHLSIQKKIPIDLIGLSLWAVRINVKLESPTQEVRTVILDLITDDNAQWQFENVSDLKNGYPLLEKAWAELTRVDLNTSIGQVIFRGEGNKNVTVVTDNFCPFCRTFYQTLPRVYRERVKEVVSIYLPLGNHPGAELACAVSSYVHSKKSLEQHARHVDDFIFNELRPPETKDVNEANAAIYDAFKSRFSWFVEEFSGLTIEKAFEKLRAGSNISEQMKYGKSLNRRGTPIIFVDGKRIDGLDWNKFERFLSY